MYVNIKAMQHEDLEEIMMISEIVMGRDYLSKKELIEDIRKSEKGGIRNNLVATDNGKIIGYVIMHAPGSWSVNQSCSPNLWPSPIERCAYYKSINVLEENRGYGVGTKLSEEAIRNAKKQRADTIIVHAWLNSPSNSSLRLMEKLGGKVIKVYEKRWYEESIQNGWECSRCGNPCYCDSAEMFILIK